MTTHERAVEVDTRLAALYGETGEAEMAIASGLSGLHWSMGEKPVYRGRQKGWAQSDPATEAAARENSLEGVVANRTDSVYLPGTRSPDWIKVKFDRTGDYVIGGWRSGARKLGGLLIGVPTPDGLAFRGRVGGGIGAHAEKTLLSRLAPLARRDSPFAAGAVPREDARGAHWVDPELVVEVRYGNRTPDGRLRFPRFLRLRDDKTPEECAEEDEDAS